MYSELFFTIGVITFWGEAESINDVVMPVNGCVCVLLLVVEVSPAKIVEHFRNLQLGLWIVTS